MSLRSRMNEALEDMLQELSDVRYEQCSATTYSFGVDTHDYEAARLHFTELLNELFKLAGEE